MFKKFFVCLLAILIVLTAAIPAFADEENTAPAEANKLVFNTRLTAGNNFTVSFVIGAEGIYAVTGRISYDSELVSYVGVSDFYNTWNVLTSDKGSSVSFLAADAMLTSAVDSECSLFNIVFKVNDDVPIGTEIAVSAENISLSDGKNDLIVDDFSSSAAVQKPLSTDAALHSLDIGEFTSSLSPEFSSDVQEYSLTVPYETEKLEIGYTANEYASVSVGDTELEVGDNTVILTVTSESGDETEEYVITVTRSEPPAAPAVLSNDASLSSLTVSAGTLSPAFSQDNDNYTLKVDYNTSVAEILPTATSPSASVDKYIVDCKNEKEFSIVCTAEDGTERTYHFTVEIERNITSIIKNIDISVKLIAVAALIVIAFIFFIIGFIVASAAKKGKKENNNEQNKVKEKNKPEKVKKEKKPKDSKNNEAADNKENTDEKSENSSETADEVSAVKEEIKQSETAKETEDTKGKEEIKDNNSVEEKKVKDGKSAPEVKDNNTESKTQPVNNNKQNNKKSKKNKKNN